MTQRKIRTGGIAVLCFMVAGVSQAANGSITNPGFETGSLPPWFQDREFGGADDWHISSDGPRSGSFFAELLHSDKELRRDFDPVQTDEILEFSLWIRSTNANAFDFFYSDGTSSRRLISPVSAGLVWDFHDITSDLSPGKTLVACGIFGNSSCPTGVDDFSLVVPEPATLGLLALGGLALIRRRRR
jgi:hypothetical protein